jgi:hypothetical protein
MPLGGNVTAHFFAPAYGTSIGDWSVAWIVSSAECEVNRGILPDVDIHFPDGAAGGRGKANGC